ncbi:MAG: hypothetical protein REH79_03715 [Spiroplasma sp.]|nr:hypothetical protein [Spiroplasma sp.]
MGEKNNLERRETMIEDGKKTINYNNSIEENKGHAFTSIINDNEFDKDNNEQDDLEYQKEKESEEITNLKQEIIKLEAKINEINSELQFITEIYAKKQRANLEYEKSIFKNNEKIAQLNLELQECKKKRDELARKIGDCINNNTNLQDLEAKINEINSELQTIVSFYKRGQKEIQEYKKSISEYDEKIAQLNLKLQEQNLDDPKLKELEEKIAQLNLELQECEKKNEELAQKLEDSANDAAKLKELEQQISQLKKDLKKSQEELEGNDDDDYIVPEGDEKETIKFIVERLEPAVPKSAKKEYELAEKKFVISDPTEISQVTPSLLLLNRKEKDGLVLKVYQEILMTNAWHNAYWNYGLHTDWAMNTLDYTAWGNKGINHRIFTKTAISSDSSSTPLSYVKMLYDSANQIYLDEVYGLIEKYLQKHGIECRVVKTFVPSNFRASKLTNSEKVLVSFGSLQFPNLKLENAKPDSLYYYIQLNFDIVFTGSKPQENYPIRGFTMLLSDALNLYKV